MQFCRVLEQIFPHGIYSKRRQHIHEPHLSSVQPTIPLFLQSRSILHFPTELTAAANYKWYFRTGSFWTFYPQIKKKKKEEELKKKGKVVQGYYWFMSVEHFHNFLCTGRKEELGRWMETEDEMASCPAAFPLMLVFWVLLAYSKLFASYKECFLQYL